MSEGVSHCTHPQETSVSALVPPQTSDGNKQYLLTFQCLKEAFRLRVLGGLTRCRYTDLDSSTSQSVDVSETAILPSSVRVVDQTMCHLTLC